MKVATKRWAKADAKKAIETIAAQVALSFGIDVPYCFIPDHKTGRDWEYQFETVKVLTQAGEAEMNVCISATFAHMYFRFDDPTLAIPFDDFMGRLNRFSGKWNSLESAPHDLSRWVGELKRDFEKVSP